MCRTISGYKVSSNALNLAILNKYISQFYCVCRGETNSMALKLKNERILLNFNQWFSNFKWFRFLIQVSLKTLWSIKREPLKFLVSNYKIIKSDIFLRFKCNFFIIIIYSFLFSSFFISLKIVFLLVIGSLPLKITNKAEVANAYWR